MGAAQAKNRGRSSSSSSGVVVSESSGLVNLDEVPARVDSVNVDGISRTKDDYVHQSIQELFMATTFNELVLRASETQKRLENLGCFRNVGIVIDASKGESASPNGYEVTFMVNEFGRFVGGVNTLVGANEGSVVFGFRLPNLLGRGERLVLEKTFGSNKNKSNIISFHKPLTKLPLKNAEWSSSIFQNSYPNTFSNFNLYSTGAILDFSFEIAQNVRNSMQWEGSWREVEASSRATSFAVREQSGHSFKSSLRHILTVDTRDHPIFPSGGILLKLAQEYAGLGGDVGFVKQDSEVQINIPLPFEFVGTGAFRIGCLWPLDSKSANHNISDLYFLGGPHSLRGFEMRSVGRRSGNDSLGGEAYWNAALHLVSPLPFSFGRGFLSEFLRAHVFINAGNIAQPEHFHDNILDHKKLLEDFRASWGCGLAVRLGRSAKIELNYCWPLRFNRGDRVVQGLQLGIGVEFI